MAKKAAWEEACEAARKATEAWPLRVDVDAQITSRRVVVWIRPSEHQYLPEPDHSGPYPARPTWAMLEAARDGIQEWVRGKYGLMASFYQSRGAGSTGKWLEVIYEGQVLDRPRPAPVPRHELNHVTSKQGGGDDHHGE